MFLPCKACNFVKSVQTSCGWLDHTLPTHCWAEGQNWQKDMSFRPPHSEPVSGPPLCAFFLGKARQLVSCSTRQILAFGSCPGEDLPAPVWVGV